MNQDQRRRAKASRRAKRVPKIKAEKRRRMRREFNEVRSRIRGNQLPPDLRDDLGDLCTCGHARHAHFFLRGPRCCVRCESCEGFELAEKG